MGALPLRDSPSRQAPGSRGAGGSAFDPSAFDPSAFGSGGARYRPHAWIGWRRRALVLAALLGCMAAFSLARWLAAAPHLDAVWQAQANGQLVLIRSALPALQQHRGAVLRAVQAADGAAAGVTFGATAGAETAIDAHALHRAVRWQPDELARATQIAQRQGWSRALDSGSVQLHFENGTRVALTPTPRGFFGLGLLFWPLIGMALLVYLLGVVLVLARPRLGSFLFLAMALCQTASLATVAVETAPGLGLNAAAWVTSLPWRVSLDLATAAAALQAWTLSPRRLPHAPLVSTAGWAVLPLWLVLTQVGAPGPAGELGVVGSLWWWAQAACLALSAAALAAISQSYRLEPNPYALVVRRFAVAMVLSFLAATAVVAWTAGLPVAGARVAEGVAVAWALSFAATLLLLPSLVRSQQLLREFALLAGISTVATALDLLFVAVFSLGATTSLTIAVFIALALYAGVRQWVLSQLLGRTMLTTERTFDRLYRAAREVQVGRAQYPVVLGALLSEFFEPLEVQRVDRVPARARLVGNGAVLVVPLRSTEDDTGPAGALALRFANRGQRLFTVDDARMADRIVDQLRRAVAYDQAVERGRSEERLRIAQDLHDDIGARLLTLMYQAPTREMEDYIRYTLQDLKTLTRGLAAADHRLSHAAAEWKSDVTQRLSAAHATLGWSFEYDRDLLLSVVQWSALTRVLRELVSNALYHGHACRVEVDFVLRGGVLTLQVADDGGGADPHAWAQGLGLGGVRKRVKLLGGRVAWRENAPRGIACALWVPDFTGRS